MSTPATPKAPQLVQDQISTINDMLLNAYSTVYKLAARIILHDKKQHEISTRQEILLTKTLLNNLWSVLDCCSRLIFCWYHGKEPTVQEARERSIKFPCEFTQLSKHNRDPNQWEKKRLSLVLLARYNDIDQDTYKQLEGVFHTVQYKGSESPDKNTQFLPTTLPAKPLHTQLAVYRGSFNRIPQPGDVKRPVHIAQYCSDGDRPC